jgi:hypothetical protein
MAENLSNSTRITVMLTDINDNPPVIQNGGLLKTIAENDGKSVMYTHLRAKIFIS